MHAGLALWWCQRRRRWRVAGASHLHDIRAVRSQLARSSGAQGAPAMIIQARSGRGAKVEKQSTQSARGAASVGNINPSPLADTRLPLHGAMVRMSPGASASSSCPSGHEAGAGHTAFPACQQQPRRRRELSVGSLNPGGAKIAPDWNTAGGADAPRRPIMSEGGDSMRRANDWHLRQRRSRQVASPGTSYDLRRVNCCA